MGQSDINGGKRKSGLWRMLATNRALARVLAGCVLVPIVAGCSLNREPSTGKLYLGANGGISGSSGANGGGGGQSSEGLVGVGGTGGVAADGGMLMSDVDAGAGALTDAGHVMCASAALKPGACHATTAGVYALKTELDVWWTDEVNSPTSPLMDPGRSKITIHFMATVSDVCDDGSAALTTLKTCGARLPPFFVDAVCKVIQIEFPDEIWDRPTMPVYKTRGSVTGFAPGDVLAIDKVTCLLGIELPTIEAPWPTAKESASFACLTGTGEQCFPDEDGDGHPGVTVHMNPGGVVTNAPYACGSGAPWVKSSAPLSIGDAAFSSVGASTAYIGVRVALGAKSKLANDCLSGAGIGESSLTIPSRIIACLVEDGSPCSASAADFVDSNTPNYHLLQAGEAPPTAPVWQHVRENPPSPIIPKVTLDRSVSSGPHSAMVRVGDLGDHIDCAAIRAANFPAFE